MGNTVFKEANSYPKRDNRDHLKERLFHTPWAQTPINQSINHQLTSQPASESIIRPREDPQMQTPDFTFWCVPGETLCLGAHGEENGVGDETSVPLFSLKGGAPQQTIYSSSPIQYHAEPGPRKVCASLQDPPQDPRAPPVHPDS